MANGGGRALKMINVIAREGCPRAATPVARAPVRVAGASGPAGAAKMLRIRGKVIMKMLMSGAGIEHLGALRPNRGRKRHAE